MGNWTHLNVVHHIIHFVDESHDRLTDTPRTEITITQHPGEQSMTLHFAICATYERERERERLEERAFLPQQQRIEEVAQMNQLTKSYSY
jgi:hypothetical protein